jgi:formate hydrogenlyase transcriptional activator
MVGYDREPSRSAPMRWTEMTPPEWRENDTRVLAELQAKGTTPLFEKELFRKDGSRVPILVGAALFEAGGTEGVAFVLDLSEQKRTEAEIRGLKDQLYRENLALRAANREISELKDKLVQEKLYLEQEIRGDMHFEQIIGSSAALKRALQLVETVAPSDSTVLLLGETGTGKELIARAIHDRSRRKERTLVKLNCAAIPTGLLESELFGHEKGAFTGAITAKIGRLELADQGTLFLDEVGDIPIEIQPKLLRALQEREFERLGSTHTRKVNVRLVAATNRDLEKMVAAREFRSDLYYRLNVFPIRIPPLRERKQDIPLLASYFVQEFAKRMQKKIDTIPADIMNALAVWEWPGNVRELENFMERAVILTRGRSLEAPLAELHKVDIDESRRSATDHGDIARIVKETIRALDGKSSFADDRETRTSPEAAPSSRPAALEELERQHILTVLSQTKGKINGPQGAAAVLKINPNTLRSRMKKLGITRLPHDIS